MEHRETSHPGPFRRFDAKGRLGRWVAAAALAASAVSLATACLDRPLCDEDCRPRTTNVLVTKVSANNVDKIDLLFMIDNSSSMADKQRVLEEAVPGLVQRLVSPNCVDPKSGEPVAGTPSEPSQNCPAPSVREFSPIRDIHVGVITSSLGGHGAHVCPNPMSDPVTTEESNDLGWLIGKRPRFSVPAGGQAPADQGFLDWNPGTHSGETTKAFTDTFRQMTAVAGEQGCGFESQLESIYRFLVDPHPYTTIATQNCPGTNYKCAVLQGRDDALLAQRKAFLRPDSLVAIIMLTDENDCSIREGGQAYYVADAGPGGLARGSSVCTTNPNDRCCYFCNTDPPAGCAADPVCAQPNPYDRNSDPPNLRCFHQKQRYGYDFLYPTARYVNAFTKPQICTSRDDLSAADPRNCKDTDGDMLPDIVDNPLFATDTVVSRDPSLVFFAGILGVPYQDIQTTTRPDGKPYANPAELHFQTAHQLATSGTWDVILGNANPGDNKPPVFPTDSLMLESVNPRGGMDAETPPAPLVGTEGGYLANKVNGHERVNPVGDDLQYACIFKLATPKHCVGSENLTGCDCKDDGSGGDPEVAVAKNPLCQDQTGNYTTTQQFAKAYPGLRELEVLKGFGDNSIVASICARNLEHPEAQDYGYQPAVDAIVERLKDKLAGSCIPRQLSPDPSGNIPCSVVEITPKSKDKPSTCNTPGRKDPDIRVADSARLELLNTRQCDTTDKPACADLMICEIQVAGEECHTGENPTAPGWCYIDPVTQKGDNPALVASCPATSRQAIRFVDPDHRTPAPGATALIACFGGKIPDEVPPSSGGAPAAP